MKNEGKGCAKFVDSVVSCCVCPLDVDRERDTNSDATSPCLKRDCEGKFAVKVILWASYLWVHRMLDVVRCRRRTVFPHRHQQSPSI